MKYSQYLKETSKLSKALGLKPINSYSSLIGGKVIRYVGFQEEGENSLVEKFRKTHTSGPISLTFQYSEMYKWLRTLTKLKPTVLGYFFAEITDYPDDVHPYYNYDKDIYIQYTNLKVNPNHLDLDKDVIMVNEEGIYFCINGNKGFTSFPNKNIGCYGNRDHIEYVHYLLNTGKITTYAQHQIS